MKKLILFFIFYFLFFINCFSQSGWFVKQNFPNHNFTEIFFINQNTGWIAADSGNIFKTTDGGENWDLYDSGNPYYFYSIKFIDSQTGWIAGGKNYWNPFGFDYGIIMKTINGGINWSQQYYNNMNSMVRDISIADQNTVYAVMGGASGNSGSSTFGAVIKTTNGGSNWVTDENVTFSSFAYTSLFFLNQNTGWIMGQYNIENWPGPRIILKTINKGLNWSLIFQDTVGASVSSFQRFKIHFCDSQNGYIGYNKIQKSTNSGQNWFISDSLLPNNDVGLFFINKDTGWICSSNFIKRTNNGGYNWTNQYSPYYVSKIFFVNSLTGWGLGANGRLLKTTTGGTTFINNISNELPDKFYLYQNYPNPFNPSTIIRYQIKESRFVTLKVYDILGKEIATLVNEKQSQREYEVPFSINQFSSYQLPSGIYFYTLHAGDYIETKKTLLIK